MRIPSLPAAAALLVLLLLTVAGAAAQEGVGPEEIAAKARAHEEVAALAAELRAKVSALAEASVVAKTEELKSKDVGVETLETVAGEMSQNIATLQSEIASLQSKRSAAAEEQAGKAKARAIELQNQIEKLKNDIAAQNNKKATMEARASDAEKKVQELNAKLERLQKTSAEQKRRVQKTQHALKVAEEELMRVQLETTTKSEQLGEVHGAWLPPWLATHAARSMELMSSQWNEHGKPAFNSLLQKASEKSVQVKEWAKPHIHTAKTKWIPVIKEKWAIAKTNTEPYMQMVSAKSVEVYQASRDAISPHVLKAHQFANPYFQEAKKLSKPYIDQVAKASKPHVKKLETTLKPYSKKFLETATLYHEQAQATILDYMHQHELLKQFATGELVWYLASAWLLMPVYVLYILVTEIFCTRKQKKSPRSEKANHGHRRHKRRHAEK
ncbi:uncharacterized protein [Lolium perenne]|uniref:uncharacterized protein isoform X1 n=1 Tax=Lolium perenne TaxID=4522 RepID=UPI0021F536C9|nr:uncharacterized protein LOC127302201 isoform X1 [Lolium perenne]XP_051188568.1 uncharacterized protein LOC127302201 isoform X1 [Lolium perenne]